MKAKWGQTEPQNHSYIYFSQNVFIWFFLIMIFLIFMKVGKYEYSNFCPNLRPVWLIFSILRLRIRFQEICLLEFFYFLHEFRWPWSIRSPSYFRFCRKLSISQKYFPPKLTTVLSNANLLVSTVLDGNEKPRVRRSTKY